MNNKMNIQEPKNFGDILKLQAILDKNISSVRDRNLRDIKTSLIAEVIELNEETKESHKTWKTKSYDKDKEREELTDIYFFLAQMINFRLQHKANFIRIKNLVENAFENRIKSETQDCLPVLDLIGHSVKGDVLNIMYSLLDITHYLGYTKEDILKTYWTKWQKNMARIGKEWN